MITLLAPDGINDVQSEPLIILTFSAFATLSEFYIEAIECWMQEILRESEMEGVGHLLFGLASGASVGHR